MCARRSTDTRRHPKQPQPPAAAAVPEPGASGSLVQNPVQATPDPAGVEVDMGASDVIDQRARRRALESRSEVAGAPPGQAPRAAGHRRVVPTVVHVGDRVSGPVSGVVERPLSTRGPGLTTPGSTDAGASVIVSPRLMDEATPSQPAFVTPAPAAAAPRPPTPPRPALAAQKQPSDSLTGPSNRPVKRERAGARPGTWLLAAAAIFALGFALTRGPSSPGRQAAVAGLGADPAERELAMAPSGSAGPTRSTGAQATTSQPPRGEAGLAPTAQGEMGPTPGLPPVKPVEELATTQAAGASAGGAAPTAEAGSAPAHEADRVEVEAKAPATRASAPSTPAKADLAGDAPTVAAGATAPTARSAPRADTRRDVERAEQIVERPTRPNPERVDPPVDTAARREAPDDAGSRYDHVLPKSAAADAERVANEGRYDHVPPKAAAANPPAPEAARPERTPTTPPATLSDAERRALDRRYDHVPPRAAQAATATADTADEPPAAPLSGSPRIFLQTDPPGATVAILGHARGKTPMSLEVDGRVEAVLTHPDRRPATVVLEPGRGARWLNIALDPL